MLQHKQPHNDVDASHNCYVLIVQGQTQPETCFVCSDAGSGGRGRDHAA